MSTAKPILVAIIVTAAIGMTTAAPNVMSSSVDSLAETREGSLSPENGLAGSQV